MGNDFTMGDGKDLAGLSRAVSPLQDQYGLDPEELRANPAMRTALMQELRSPMATQESIQAALKRVPPAAAAPAVGRTAPPAPADPVSPAVGQQPQAPGGVQQPPVQAPAVTGAAPSATDKSGTATPGLSSRLNDVGIEALQRGLKLGQFADTTAQQMAADPGPDTAALEAQRAKDAIPTPYRDPTTGNVLPEAKQFEPTGLQRFGRGLKSAVIGAVTGGIPGAVVGAIEPGMIRGGTAYGAPNRAFQTTEAAREARLGSEDQQITSATERFKAMTDARSKAAAEARTGVTAYNDAAKGAQGLEDAQTNADKEAREARENSPTGKADAATALSQAKFEQLGREADRLHLAGNMRTLYIANGKLPDPRQATAEEIAVSQATKVFRQQYGREPATLAEYQQIQQAARGGGSGNGMNGAASRLSKPYQTAVTSAEAQIEKIDEATNLIQGSAEAQALGIPKVLTALVSGQGTGVRITQAELNAIAQARGWSGDFEGTLNKISGKGHLSSEQQQELTGILSDARRRIAQKQQIANEALDAINGASSEADIAAADTTARRKMQQLESNGGGAASPAGAGPSSGWLTQFPKAQ